MNDMFEKLREPFPASDIEWRVQSAGEKDGKVWAMVLAYVTNRAIMERLDTVVGPAFWKNEYAKGPEGGILCGLSIKIDNEWITKWDGAENTEFESVKGGLSSSMKRTAVQWGIGRYLYNLSATFAIVSQNGKHFQQGKQGKYQSFKWDEPRLPDWALPGGSVDDDPYKDKPENLKAYYMSHPLLTEEEKGRLEKYDTIDEKLKNTLDALISGRAK